MGHPLPILLYFVMVLYLYFALQVLWQTRWDRVARRSATALLSLIIVFVLCALAHVTAILPQSWWLARQVLYGALVIASAVLVWTNQAKVVSVLMEHPPDE